jgi:FG-GAP-like repeat
MEKNMKTTTIILTIICSFQLFKLFAQNPIVQLGTWNIDDDHKLKCVNLNTKGSDLNNDGYDDFIHLANDFPEDEWKFQFFMGNNDLNSTYDFDLDIPFGTGYPSWGGDLNNDGFNDIVYFEASYLSDPGSVNICFGGETIDLEPELIINGEDYVSDPWGLALQGSNGGYDFNGDGYHDLLTWSEGPQYYWNGLIQIFMGNETMSSVPEFQIQGYECEQIAHFRAVADINGDNYDDLLISRYGTSVEPPADVEIYLGGIDMDTICDFILPDVWFEPNYYRMQKGDVNNDGCDDVLLSSGVLFGNSDIDELHFYPNEGWYDYAYINDDEISDLLFWDMNVDSLYVYYGHTDFNWEHDLSLPMNPVAHSHNYSKIFCNLGDINGDGEDELLINETEDNLPSNVASIFGLYTPNNSDNNLISYNKIQISNYPNPFNPSTTISFDSLTNIDNPIVEIFNVKGNKIKTLPINLSGASGSALWDGTDNLRNQVSSGVYFYRVKTNDRISETKKMLLMK